jgi:hypothetical protein
VKELLCLKYVTLLSIEKYEQYEHCQCSEKEKIGSFKRQASIQNRILKNNPVITPVQWSEVMLLTCLPKEVNLLLMGNS